MKSEPVDRADAQKFLDLQERIQELETREESLRTVEEQLREECTFREAVVQRAAEGLCVCHQIPHFPFVEFSVWNDRMTEITGYTMEQINRYGWYQTVYSDPDTQARAAERMAEMYGGSDLRGEEWVITRSDGKTRVLQISTSVLKTREGTVHVLGLMHDVTERVQAQGALLEAEREKVTILDSVSELVAYQDKNLRIIWANRAAVESVGETARNLIGRHCYEVWARDNQACKGCPVVKALETGESQQAEMTTYDGRIWWVRGYPVKDIDGQVSGVVEVTQNVTELKKAEQKHRELQDKLEKAERMESLGILAGGVAHDLNNMLGPLVGYTDLILMQLPEESPLRGKIEKIGRAARDAANVIQDLLTLARRGRYEMVPVDLNEVVKSYFKSPAFTESFISRENITLTRTLSPSPLPILGSMPHLSKVVMNLIVNAMDAMPEGGELSVETEIRSLERILSGQIQLQPGEYALLRIKDTGHGIDSDELDKIFEPYFSKKKLGTSGSGLGLSVVYGIVKDHKGYYDVFSEPGRGAEFVLYFPLTTQAAQFDTGHKSELSGSESVLVVDDSESQRELATDILVNLGYTVVTVSGGDEAIEYLKSNSVDIVLLDMIMEGGPDGLDTYRGIIKIQPGQKAIIVSGYSETDRVRELQRLGGGEYLRKPYTIEKLARAIRRELDSPVNRIAGA